MIKKTVIINRAVPGSGKTTITNCIIKELKEKSISISVHSTDDFFMKDNRYIFNLEKLNTYHNKNLELFKKSIENNIDVVICDNTNIAPWQTEAYTKLARENKYQILIITLDPRELVKHVESQLITKDRPYAHGVEEKILKSMIDEYYQFDALLSKNILVNEKQHIHYLWDININKKVKVGIAKHFESDYIIRILPDEYSRIQEDIGLKVLRLVRNIKR